MKKGKTPDAQRMWKFIKYGKTIPKGKLIPKLETPCWNWTGAINEKGYGVFHYDSGTFKAHRFVYEYLVDKITEGLELDHLCRNKKCVNPEHLKPKPHIENVRAGINGSDDQWQRKKTHCKNGHKFTIKNTRITVRGIRVCIKCAVIHGKKSNERAKAKRKLMVIAI